MTKSKPKRTGPSTQPLPTIPTVQKMTTWNEATLLQWIQQEKPNLLRREYLDKFTAAGFLGETFLRRAGDVDFFMKAGLSLGVSEVLANMGDKVKQGKFIPRTVKGNNLSKQTAGRKRKADEVDAPEPPISPRRNRRTELLSELATRAREQRKRIKEIILGINGSSNQHSNSVDPLPRAVDKLSDPTFECTLAFPLVGFEAPFRFKVDKGDWKYVGRKKFTELLQALKEVRKSENLNTVWLYGTQGYGKSHLLAALVCYLIAQDERVVYIPDCRALLEDPVLYVQAVMLFAWADDITTQKEIMTLNTDEDIRNFFNSQKNIIIFIDQKNALKELTQKMNDLKAWLTSLAFRHKRVFSCSANHPDYHKEVHRENSSKVVDVFGGLEETEMDQWWKRHGDIDMGGYERSDVEGVTGCIPLLLSKCVVGKKIDLNMTALRDIYEKATAFTRNVRKITKSDPDRWNWYRTYVTDCFCHRSIAFGWTADEDLIDHRYFYQRYEDGDGYGDYTCDLVRNAVTDQLLLEENFADTDFIDNKSVAGYMIEHAVLSSIRSRGLAIGEGIEKSMDLKPVKDLFEVREAVTDKPVLYRPQKFNFKAIDGIILLIKPDKLNDEKDAKKTKKKKKKLMMFPLQITLAPATHASSREQFLEDYSERITNLSKQFDVEVQFLWITPECRDSQEYPANPEKKWPKHVERYIPLKVVRGQGDLGEVQSCSKKATSERATSKRASLNI